MAEFYGKDLMFQWKTSGGTTDLSEYQRGASYSPSGKIDVNTTGSATWETRQVGVRDFTASYRGLSQGGTIIASQLDFGSAGTIMLYPEGSVAGKLVLTLPAISQGLQQNYQYDQLVELNVSFVGNGPVVIGTA